MASRIYILGYARIGVALFLWLSSAPEYRARSCEQFELRMPILPRFHWQLLGTQTDGIVTLGAEPR